MVVNKCDEVPRPPTNRVSIGPHKSLWMRLSNRKERSEDLHIDINDLWALPSTLVLQPQKAENTSNEPFLNICTTPISFTRARISYQIRQEATKFALTTGQASLFTNSVERALQSPRYYSPISLLNNALLISKCCAEPFHIHRTAWR